MPPDSSVVTLPSSSFSLNPGRLGLSFPYQAPSPELTSNAASLAPAPGPQAAPCSDPPSLRSRRTAQPREYPQEPSTTDPRPEDPPSPRRCRPLEGWLRSTEGANALPPAYLFPGRPTGRQHSRRKVAQLARQVCLSSNRTQEEAQGVLTLPADQAGSTPPEVERLPARDRSRASAGDSPPPR